MKSNRRALSLSVIILQMLLLVTHGNSSEVPDRLIALFDVKLNEAGLVRDIRDPDNLSNIIKWSKKSDLSTHCSYWLEYHADRNPSYLPLRMALADSYFSGGDWRELEAKVLNEDWKFQDHFRLIYLAFAERELMKSEWVETWATAVETASKDSEKTRSLIQFLAQWKKWGPELESLLWQQVEPDNPLDAMALNSLVRYYEMQNNAGGLMKVNAHLLAMDPTNPELINNEVSIHILTGQIEDVNLGRILDLQSHADLNPKYLLTLALYYLEFEKSQDAWQYLERIPGGWFEENPGQRPYAEYLKRVRGVESNLSDEAFRDLVQSSDLQGFEKTYLLSALDRVLGL